MTNAKRCKAVVGRLESLEERIVSQQTARRRRGEPTGVRTEPRAEERARDLDERMNELSRRIEARRQGPRRDPRAARASTLTTPSRRSRAADRNWMRRPPPARPNPLQGAPGAISASTRRSPIGRTDAPDPRRRRRTRRRRTRGKSDCGAGAERGGGVAGGDPETQPAARRNATRAKRKARGAGRPISRPCAPNSPPCRAASPILRPRNAVVALEGAIRDLGQRVAASPRERRARQSARAGRRARRRTCAKPCAPMIRATPSRRCSARSAPSARRSTASPTRSIDPATFERIRRQIEETRSFLGALAQRPAPLDRLERQIGELADRVDRLSTSPAPQPNWPKSPPSLAEARAQVERSTPPSALDLDRMAVGADRRRRWIRRWSVRPRRPRRVQFRRARRFVAAHRRRAREHRDPLCFAARRAARHQAARADDARNQRQARPADRRLSIRPLSRA